MHIQRYCTYLSKHPSGWFYAGKGTTSAVASGKYRGSGVLISKLFKKHPKHEWSCEILQTFETEEEAYAAEAALVTETFVAQPKCANLDTGGRHTTRHADTRDAISASLKRARASEDKAKISAIYAETQRRPEVRAAKSAGIKAAIASPEHRARMSATSKKALNQPEVQAKLSTASSQMWAVPEMREKILTARAGKARAWVRISVHETEYPSMAEACRATGLTRQRLKAQPSFKELS